MVWRWWRQSWRRGVKRGGEGVVGVGWGSWKKGFVGGGLGRRRGRASFSAIGTAARHNQIKTG